jgi:hypothetical protein
MAADHAGQCFRLLGDDWRLGRLNRWWLAQGAQSLSREFHEAQRLVGGRCFRFRRNGELSRYFLSSLPKLLQPLRGLLDETHIETLG